MWIERVRIRGWGGFDEEAAFSLDRRSTVVLGENESGKTSLASALGAAFFGAQETPFQHEGESWAELDLRVDAREITLRRDFQAGTVRLAERRPDPRTLVEGTDEEALRSALQDLGVPDAAAWKRAAFVLQGDLAAGIDTRVSDWVSGNGDGAHQVALSRLEAQRRELAGDGGARPGRIEEIQQELSVRRDDLGGWESRAARIREATSEIQALGRDKQRAEASARERGEVLDNLIRFQELTRERARQEEGLATLRQERDRTRRQVESVERVEADLEQEFPDFLNAPMDLEDIIHSWMESATRLRHLQSDQERAAHALHGLPRTRTRRNGGLAALALAGLGWLACVGAGAGTLGLFFVPFFAAAGYGAVWYLDLNADRLRRERAQEIERLGEEREEMERRERDARNRLGMLGRFSNPLILRKEFRRFLEARSDLERAKGARDSQRPLSEVVNAYEEVLNALQVIDTETRDLVVRARYLSSLDGSPQAMTEELEKASIRQEEVRTEVEALTGQAEQLEAELARLEAETPDPARLAEDIRRLEEEERRVAGEASALEEALRSVRRAVESYQAGHLDRLARGTAQLFHAFSLGRFSEVRFTAGHEPEARGEGAPWTPCSRMSRGTRDQLFLALRLALIESLGESVPVVLDEVFPLWDDARLEEARRVLADRAEKGSQILIATRDTRLTRWTKKVVRLKAPQTGESGLRAA